MTALGADEVGVLRWLARLNFLALVGIITALGFTSWKEKPRWLAPISIVVMITGPAAYFGTTAFGEMLAASMLLGAVLAAYYRLPVFAFLFASLATVSRETMAPFVLAFMAVAMILSSGRSEDRWRTVAVSGAAGVGMGVALNIGFNVFRYGAPQNLLYLDPLFRVPDLSTAAEFFAMLNLAPGGGILFFWPLVFGLVLGVIAVASVRLVKKPTKVGDWFPSALLGSTYVLFVVGLSFWHSPFGWISWGPRLLIPIVPAFVFLGLGLVAPTVERLGKKLQTGATWIPWAIVVAVVALSIPQWSGPWAYRGVLSTLTTPDAICETLVIIQDDPVEYYRCTQHIAWRLQPSQLAAAATGGGGNAWVARIVGSLMVATLLASAYQRFRRDQMAYANDGP